MSASSRVTLSRDGQPLLHDLREGADEGWIVVERFDPVQLEPELRSALPCFHVQVPEDLQMVGNESDGRDEHLANALAVEAVELVENVRPEPRLAGRARALEGERPAVAKAGACGDEARGREQLVLVGIPRVEDPRGQRVRREHDPRVGAADAVGDHVEERWTVVPAFDELQLRASLERRLEPLAVLADRHSGVVRREHEADDPRRAPGQRGGDRLGDAGAPVLHPDEDRDAELTLERRALRLGDVVERRPSADPAVALGQLLDGFVGDRLAAADVLEVRPDVVRARRASIGHQDHGIAHAATSVRSWTSSTRRRKTAGSVSGTTPWPRLKMWPGRPPARASTSSAPAATRSQGPSRAAPSRLPWIPWSWPTRSQAASSGTRQSTPITSPPTSARSSSRCASPVAKWMVGTSTAASTRAE